MLDKEYGEGKGVILKWQGNIAVRVLKGSEEERNKVYSVIDELNQVLQGTPTKFVLSETASAQEFRIYIGTAKALEKDAIKEKAALPANFAGYARITWDTLHRRIFHSSVYIARYRIQKSLLRHVILEEITQTLGLMGDNTVIPESVSYSRGNDQGHAPSLSEFDKNALLLLYNHLKAGDDALRVGVAYAKFWSKR